MALAYLLDAIDIARRGGETLDCLLFSAILDANVAHVRQDPLLQRNFSAMDLPVPDELRRPISISAVANSLRLPFETVRRRIRAMAANGDCVIDARGVVVTAEILLKPEIQAMGARQYMRLRQFYLDLRDSGVTPPVKADEAGLDAIDDITPVRAAIRVLSEFVMRFIDNVMARMGDPLTALIILHMAVANTEHMTIAEIDKIPVPDHLRRPISVVALAKRLHTPTETVRRRVVWLTANGFAARRDGGLIALIDGHPRPGVVATAGGIIGDLHRLFARLNRLGLLAQWDREIAPPRVSAA